MLSTDGKLVQVGLPADSPDIKAPLYDIVFNQKVRVPAALLLPPATLSPPCCVARMHATPLPLSLPLPQAVCGSIVGGRADMIEMLE